MKTRLDWANEFWKFFVREVKLNPDYYVPFVKGFINREGHVDMGNNRLLDTSRINFCIDVAERFILHGNYKHGMWEEWQQLERETIKLRGQYFKANGDTLPAGDQNVGYCKPDLNV